MNVYELQESYKSGDSTWTKHGPNGLSPNTEQFDLNGGAEHHITVNYDAKGNITGVHYTIRNEANTLFHLYYYLDNNSYNIDYSGTRNPKTIDITLIKLRLAGWCVASQYAIQSPNGKILNWSAFKTLVKKLDEDVPTGRKTKRGTVLDLTGGGARRY
jgi:hypothetical protein